MALGRLTLTANAGVGPYAINGLDYLSTGHLSVTVNGVPAAAAFDDALKTMTLAVAPAAGATIVVQRATPRRQEERLTQFLSLPSGQGGLTAALLDQDYRQNMLLAGEGRDIADDTVGMDGLGLGAGLQWDGEARRVENLAAASTPGGAVIKSQLDAMAAAARPLPTVSGADNDDGLFVNAGEFAKRTPTQGRAHLALGTVALLAAGVAANNVAQLDSLARYPTADGRNIDLTSHALQTAINQRALATVVRFSAQNLASPGGIDPSLSTWSQSSSTRLNLSGGWSGRVELNNSGDVDGSAITPYRIRLTAGTWRIRWLFKVTMPVLSSSTNLTSLRLTNNDDTSSQVVYYDLGPHRPSVDFGNLDWSMFPDSILLSLPSADGVVFRYANKFSGGANQCDFAVLFHKVSTSLAS